MRRLFFATLGTETNTFSPLPTGWSIWRETLLRRRSDADDEPTVSRRHAVYKPFFARLDTRGWTLLPGLQAFAVPAGITPRGVYEGLRDELLRDLEESMPIDGVLLFLHGAMVADGYDDCEGDLLSRVRARIGPAVPLVAELDLHCHVTDAMLSQASALVGYKHYPHVDTYERLLDAFEIVADAAEGRARPVMASAECHMIGLFHTTTEPMKGLVDRMYALEREPGVLNVWLAHGFPYGDVPFIGARTVVVTDGDEQRAQAIAADLRDRFFAMREQVDPPWLGIDAAIDEAVASADFPVTIADTADNTGGGAPGDSTFFLERLIERQIGDVALGPLYDPGAVSICHDAGTGATLRLRIGGKLSIDSGRPIDVRCTVTGLSERVIQQLNGGPTSLGACAAVRVEAGGVVHNSARTQVSSSGIDVVLCSRRVQAGSPELFTSLGIEPREKRLIVVKSTQHFHAGFAPISARILYTGDRGALQRDITSIPYQRIERSRYWPFVRRPSLES